MRAADIEVFALLSSVQRLTWLDPVLHTCMTGQRLAPAALFPQWPWDQTLRLQDALHIFTLLGYMSQHGGRDSPCPALQNEHKCGCGRHGAHWNHSVFSNLPQPQPETTLTTYLRLSFTASLLSCARTHLNHLILRPHRAIRHYSRYTRTGSPIYTLELDMNCLLDSGLLVFSLDALETMRFFDIGGRHPLLDLQPQSDEQLSLPTLTALKLGVEDTSNTPTIRPSVNCPNLPSTPKALKTTD
ncbi:hypothetical protein DL89DRAFT_262867 [Linderina pennispora]|uniref:Uncharacterized protein n=1 Tax=Linderina pennispora TaxID=61395 RepID=A0A1Y1VSK6_9FUNG|nr:uncharacterized protein DL89DRAFT_262867 [Linderina pennispora]ORX64005.1 hypothetical protein DL89DRAFT_262867 [Linderina pennispora]